MCYVLDMLRLQVVIDLIGHGRLNVEAEFDAEQLHSDNPPMHLRGRFLGDIDPDTHRLLHDERTEGGSSHTLWLFNCGHGYRFTMDSQDSLWFRADHLHVNPATGLPGFQR